MSTTIARALPSQRFASASVDRQQKKRQVLQFVVIWTLIFLSAFAVVYSKDVYRRTFIQYQNIQEQQNQLYVDWGKLLLEQSTWSTQARIQKIAASRLNMQVPAPKAVVLID